MTSYKEGEEGDRRWVLASYSWGFVFERPNIATPILRIINQCDLSNPINEQSVEQVKMGHD